MGAAPRGLGTAIATAPPARGAFRGSCERGVPGLGVRQSWNLVGLDRGSPREDKSEAAKHS